MTNLEFLRKHSYAEIVADTLDKYLGNLYTVYYSEEDEDELLHLRWLFAERKERNVQLPEDQRSEIRGHDVPLRES